MVVIVDTSSFSRLVQYYLPFDKKGILLPLIEEEVQNGRLIVIDKVLAECSYLSKGIIIESIPFLRDKRFKPFDTDGKVPPASFIKLVDNNFIIRRRYNGLDEGKKQAQREAYINGADFAILFCAHLNAEKLKGSLFGDTVEIMTEESAYQNDGKCFKKIPLCCKSLNPEVKTITVVDYLKRLTNDRLLFDVFS